MAEKRPASYLHQDTGPSQMLNQVVFAVDPGKPLRVGQYWHVACRHKAEAESGKLRRRGMMRRLKQKVSRPSKGWHSATPQPRNQVRVEMNIGTQRQGKRDVSVGQNRRKPLHRTSDVLSLIHISEPTRQAEISYAVFC